MTRASRYDTPSGLPLSTHHVAHTHRILPTDKVFFSFLTQHTLETCTSEGNAGELHTDDKNQHNEHSEIGYDT